MRESRTYASRSARRHRQRAVTPPPTSTRHRGAGGGCSYAHIGSRSQQNVLNSQDVARGGSTPTVRENLMPVASLNASAYVRSNTSVLLKLRKSPLDRLAN